MKDNPLKPVLENNNKSELMQDKWYKRLLLHVAFWAFYMLFFGLFYGKDGKNYSLHLLETMVMLPFVMTATYLTIYGILPFYLKSRKLFYSVVLIVVLQVVVTLGERIFLQFVNQLPVTFESLWGITSIYLLLETNFMVTIAFAIKFYKIWYEQQEEKYRMEKENLENELNLLKAQLNPHFLFNTMNNLYALSLENEHKTSEGIARISDLLRSVLYECNEREITLEKEIEIIRNYIELEQMRYRNRLNVDFTVNGDPGEMKIAPMVLFTFVENCFKHGSSADPDQTHIKIEISIQNGELLFTTKNSKPKESSNMQSQKIGGIGLNNVKKRLQILYQGKYELNCSGNENCYNLRFWLKNK